MKTREERIEYLREYRRKNKELISIKRRLKRERDPERVRAQCRKSRAKNRKKFNEGSISWYHKNKEAISERRKAKYEADKKDGVPYSLRYYYENRHKPEYKLKEFIRHSMQNVVRKAKHVNGAVDYVYKEISNKKAIELIGCSVDDFIKHIESKFEHGMTWGNHGEWEFDHVFPVSKCIEMYGGDEAPALVNHYTNIQPLWWDKNRSKSNKI